MIMKKENFYVKPITLTRSLRDMLNLSLGYPLKVNDQIRYLLKNKPGEKLTYLEIVNTIISCKSFKRIKIPNNMYYNIHTRSYWAENPKGTKTHCISEWWRLKTLYYQGVISSYKQSLKDKY